MHAFPVIECDIGCAVFEFYRAVERAGRQAVVPIRLVERPMSEAFPYFTFVAWVDIQGIAVIAADRHAAVGDRPEHPALAVSEPGPAGTVDAGKLHIIKRQFFRPVLPPVFCQKMKQPLMCFHIVSIRFSLIPDDTPYRELFERPDTRLV